MRSTLRSISAALLGLLLAQSCWAQSEFVPPGSGNGMNTSAGNAVLPAARGSLQTEFCLDPVSIYGADPTGVADSTTAIQNAVNAAAVLGTLTTPGIVCIPGGNYKTTTVITIQSSFVHIRGAGSQLTTILPTNTGDVFYFAKSPVAQYLSGGRVSGMTIFRNDNATAGAAVHWNNAAQGGCIDVLATGTFYGFQFTSSINMETTQCRVSGANTTAGSAQWRFDNSTDVAGVNIVDVGTSNSGGNYDYGVYIQTADGVTYRGHLGASGGARTAGLYLHPINTTDKIDNVDFSQVVIDTSNYGVLCDTQPGGYTANFGQLWFVGTQIHGSTIDGFHNDCAAMHDVHGEGMGFLTNGSSGIAISVGNHFDFSHSIFNGSNGANNASPHVLLSSPATEINLDGAMFYTGSGTHNAPYDIAVTGNAQNVRAHGLISKNSNTADVLASNGTNLDIQFTSSDRNPSVASCTGLGSGTCAFANAPSATNNKFTVTLSPTGSPSSSGAFTVTFPYTTRQQWNCLYNLMTGSGTWAATASVQVTSATATTSVVGWNNQGTNLTAASTYNITGQCAAS